MKKEVVEDDMTGVQIPPGTVYWQVKFLDGHGSFNGNENVTADFRLPQDALTYVSETISKGKIVKLLLEKKTAP